MDDIIWFGVDGIAFHVYRNPDKGDCITIDIDTGGSTREDDHHDAADTKIPRLRLFVNEELSYIASDGRWVHIHALDEKD